VYQAIPVLQLVDFTEAKQTLVVTVGSRWLSWGTFLTTLVLVRLAYTCVCHGKESWVHRLCVLPALIDIAVHRRIDQHGKCYPKHDIDSFVGVSLFS